MPYHFGRCQALDGKSDEELKLSGLKHFYPDLEVANHDQSYLDGMFEAICSLKSARNDSLASARQAIHNNSQQSKANVAYEKWVEQSAKLWQRPWLVGFKEDFNEYAD